MFTVRDVSIGHHVYIGIRGDKVFCDLGRVFGFSPGIGGKTIVRLSVTSLYRLPGQILTFATLEQDLDGEAAGDRWRLLRRNVLVADKVDFLQREPIYRIFLRSVV